jgi:hypothetical protein
MRVTLILPIALIGVAALSCLLVKRRKRTQAAAPADASAAPPAEIPA